VNLAWNKSFDWDGQFSSLVNEAANKIHSMNAMGETYEGIINKLNQDKEYRDAFETVFGNSFIKPEFIFKAIAQFTGSLVSADSKYDRVKKGMASFTPVEDHGYQLYKINCASCHTEPLFTDQSIRNIGLPLDNFLKDYGRMMFTHKREDSLKFKVPTLRNVAVSSNYMHDGRFNTLYQVLNHYRTGIQQSPTLDPLLINGINLNNTEVNDLVSFLKTLTDTGFLNNPKFRE
jgi:cytochrome c peroxidase